MRILPFFGLAFLFILFDLNSHQSIIQINSLTQIPDSQTPETHYFFDIDDTLIDPPFMLGSRAWRKYIAGVTKDDTEENWHDALSLLLVKKYPTSPVESMTPQFIKNLQMKGHFVLGLTARERQKWYDTYVDNIDALTIHQLESIGITLDQPYPFINAAPEYFKGVFFADTEHKGDYILKLFKDSVLPKKVTFIDDKKSRVESVAAALDKLGIEHECYWYTATNEKANRFNPLIANIQLYHFLTTNQVISDAEAGFLAEPERNEEYYLHLILESAADHLKCGA